MGASHVVQMVKNPPAMQEIWLQSLGGVDSLEKVKVAQSCPTLRDFMDYTVRGILQARILEWVAFPFSRRSSQPRDQTQVSCIAGGFFTSWATREAQIPWRREWLMVTHSSIPAWRISMIEESGGSQRRPSGVHGVTKSQAQLGSWHFTFSRSFWFMLKFEKDGLQWTRPGKEYIAHLALCCEYEKGFLVKSVISPNSVSWLFSLWFVSVCLL